MAAQFQPYWVSSGGVTSFHLGGNAGILVWPHEMTQDEGEAMLERLKPLSFSGDPVDQNTGDAARAWRLIASARDAILRIGYFAPDEVDEHLAPRITEYASHVRRVMQLQRMRLEDLTAELGKALIMASTSRDGASGHHEKQVRAELARELLTVLGRDIGWEEVDRRADTDG